MLTDYRQTERRIMTCLADGIPQSLREIMNELHLDDGAVGGSLRRCWLRGLIVRWLQVQVGSRALTFDCKAFSC